MFFFQFWYGPCSFSQICFMENDMFACCWPTFVFFTFCRIKKTCIEFVRRSFHFSAHELRSENISCIFRWCRYQNNPRLSSNLLVGKIQPRVNIVAWFLYHCYCFFTKNYVIVNEFELVSITMYSTIGFLEKTHCLNHIWYMLTISYICLTIFGTFWQYVVHF